MNELPEEPLGPGMGGRRRTSLARVAAAAGSIFLPGPAVTRSARASAEEPSEGPIRAENRQTGALDWQLTRVRADPAHFRSPWIEGYCSKQSVRHGESLDLLVSTDPA